MLRNPEKETTEIQGRTNNDEMAFDHELAQSNRDG
jgi:hypothetical protein